MIKIKFSREYTPRHEGAPTYRPGQIVELSRASANHFVSRGAAEYLQAAQIVERVEEIEEKKTQSSASQRGRLSLKKTASESGTSQQSESTTPTE